MKPLWYVDFSVAAGVSARGPSGSSIAAVAMFLRTVHGAASAQGLRFASALRRARSPRYCPSCVHARAVAV
jgi:hypothetical protein